MIRLLLFLLLVSVSLHVCAQAPATYTNTEGRYSITPTSGWKVRINGSDSFVYAPPDGQMDQWDEKLEFSITDGEDIALDDAFDFYINTDFPAAYENFKLIAKGDEQINGLPVKWATFTFSATGQAASATTTGDSTISATLQALFYVIKKNNSLYLVNGVTGKSLFPKFDLPFRIIIRTFRVTND